MLGQAYGLSLLHLQDWSCECGRVCRASSSRSRVMALTRSSVT